MYSSTFSLTSALDRVGGQGRTITALPPWKRPDTHCTGGERVSGPVWTGAQDLASPREFEPRAAQPAASHYTDRAILPFTSLQRNSPYVSEVHKNQMQNIPLLDHDLSNGAASQHTSSYKQCTDQGGLLKTFTILHVLWTKRNSSQLFVSCIRKPFFF
jgi:hypothetical protein